MRRINLIALAAVIKKLGLNLPLCVLGAGAIHALLLAVALPMLITLPNPAALVDTTETDDPSTVAIDTGPPVSDPDALEVDVEIVTTPQGDISAANEPAAAPAEDAGESAGAAAPAVNLDYAERLPIATPLPPRALEPLPAKPAVPPAQTAAVEAADPVPTGSISDNKNTAGLPAPSSAGQTAAAPSSSIPAPHVSSTLPGDVAAPDAAEEEARAIPAPVPHAAKDSKGVAGAAAVMASADPTDAPAPKPVVEDPGPPPPLPKRKPSFTKPVASVAPASVEKKRVTVPKAAPRPAQHRAVPRPRTPRSAPVAGRRSTSVGPPTTGTWGQLLNAPNSQPIPKGRAYGTSR